MREADISEAEILHRIDIGLLIREFRGVYRVGHTAPNIRSTYMAAVKACGKGAVLCGRAAGYLWGILRCPSPPPPEVMTTTERKVEGIKRRRTRRLDRRDVTTLGAIPCTTVARTIVDLAAGRDEDALARVCHEAGVKYGTTPRQVGWVLERRPNAPGSKVLRAVMSGEVKVSLSVVEKAFLDALEQADLPLPDQVNKPAGGKRVDCRWSEYGVTVELLSYRFHNSKYSWDQDHERKRQARARGDEWRAFTYDDVFKDQTYMLSELRDLLRPEATRSSASNATGRARGDRRAGRAGRSPRSPR